MSDESESRDRDDRLDPEQVEFIENFASAVESMNDSRMSGRVLGLLLISDEPYMSAARIATLLRASAGAISMATRQLVKVGFISKHTVPGDRRHYFRVEDDVWGAFLAGERDYLRRMTAVLSSGMQTASGQRPGPRTRLRNGARYMTWLEQYHRKMLRDWYAYRDQEQDDIPAGDTTEREDP